MIDGLIDITDGALFASVEDGRRALLDASPMSDLRPGEKVVDLFCGAGGWGEGARELGVGVDFAVNHWDVAIDTHRENNPACVHHRGDAWRARPRDIVGDADIGLLLASAACTTHSRARGSAPVSKRVHMLGWCIARWMREVSPRLVLIENVPEWQDWGPLVDKVDPGTRKPVRDDQGRIIRVQCPKRRGQHFRRWWRQCQRLGYEMEMRVLDAPDYGSPSRRRRLFIIARRDGMPIVWPERTHGLSQVGPLSGESRRRRMDSAEAVPSPGAHRRSSSEVGGAHKPGASASGVGHASQLETDGKALIPFRTAAECIDWSDLGRSIFDRKKDLAPKTLKRLAQGVGRYVLRDPAPFVLRVTHGDGRGWHVSPIDATMPTQTTRQDLAVCAPVVAPQNTGVFGQRPDRVGPTITTKGHQSLIAPILATTGYGEREGQAARCNRADGLLNTCVDGVKQAVVTPVMTELYGTATSGRRVDAPLGAVTSQGNHAGVAVPLLAEYYGNSTTLRPADQPLGAVVTVDRHASVTPVLSCAELALARGLRVARFLREMLGAMVPIDEETGLAFTIIGGVKRFFVDILFRMLRPRELAKAMGFRADYQWPRSQRDTVKLIGNAVSPMQALALLGALLPRLLRPGRRRAAA